jgi:hypothetical protein
MCNARFMRWLLLLVSLPASAAPLEMRYLRSENLHIANQGGAINWFDETTLTLDLKSDGTLVGREAGKSREHNLYDSYTTEELQTWTQQWSGRWKQSGATLALDVVLGARTCTHTKQASDGKPEQLTCKTVTPKIHLDCTTTQVTLRTASQTPDKRDVWQCVPAGTVELDRTPTPWTFGKTSCVKTLGGRGFSYERC